MPMPSVPEARRCLRAFALSAALVAGVCALPHPALAMGAIAANADVAGTVRDSVTGQPVQGADVALLAGSAIVVGATSDAFGRYTLHDVAPGSYTIVARYVGYRFQRRALVVAPGASTARADFVLSRAILDLETVQVTAGTPLAVDTRTGNQVFKQDQYQGSPTNTTSQILQQSIAGAARAPTGEVHIRGQHAEYTYYVDGVPVPAGISGSLNELFDPSVVQQIDFQTGGWDAEYGNKNAAVINVTTRVPAGGFHGDVSAFGGSFGTNGQSVSASTTAGRVGVFVAATRQSTDMRREPVVFDTASGRGVNFHNHGEDLYGFGKLQFVAGPHDVLNLDVNASRTRFEVPFDPALGITDDRQQDVNGFVNLGYRHAFAGDVTAADTAARGGAPGDLFVGLFVRNGSLRYTPGADDEPAFVFPGDTTAYVLRERRSFTATGVKADYTARPVHDVEIKTGTMAYLTRGREDFGSLDARGAEGPASNSVLRGSDVGVYAQASIAPREWVELRTGIRYDSHVAPFAGNQRQWSPRVRLNLFPSEATSLWAYYGRLFVPTNVEDLRAITSIAQQGVAAAPTLPERDDFFEVGGVHRFPVGLVARLSAYYKRSSPGIDDATVPGSQILTSVNIDSVYIKGLEGVLEVRPPGPLSGSLNLSVNHAYGKGPIVGGFFPPDSSSVQQYFDLDHDQRYSAVANVVYSARGLTLTATGIYGSGLTNGVERADASDAAYGTGLFARNPAFKVRPGAIANLSAGYAFVVGRTVVRPQLNVDNVFDRRYLLKGAFFSGASVGRPRSVQLRVNVGL